MITVKVKLFASLRERYPNHPLGQPMPVQLPPNSTLEYLIEHLALTNAIITFVNGIAQTDRNTVLHESDELAIFPLIGGG